MSWEALTAIGTLASALVIAVTVVMAARQVRVTSDQVAQMRRAAQFDAARTVLLELDSPAFINAYRFVYHELPRLLTTDSFRRELAQIGVSDQSVHQELFVLRAFDRIGTYIRFGLVDGEIIYSSYSPRIVVCWEALRPVVEVHQAMSGVPMFQNFRFLYDDCRRWLAKERWEIDVAATSERIAQYQAGFPPGPASPADQ